MHRPIGSCDDLTLHFLNLAIMQQTLIADIHGNLPEDDQHPYRTGAWHPNTREYDVISPEVTGDLPHDLSGRAVLINEMGELVQNAVRPAVMAAIAPALPASQSCNSSSRYQPHLLPLLPRATSRGCV